MFAAKNFADGDKISGAFAQACGACNPTNTGHAATAMQASVSHGHIAPAAPSAHASAPTAKSSAPKPH